MRDIYQEIASAAAEFGRRRGQWLILVAARPDVPKEVSYFSVEQFASLIDSTTVLYSSPQADITDELLKVLDAQYAGQPVPWPAAQPAVASPPPVRIIDEAEVVKRTGLDSVGLKEAIYQLATQRGYLLVIPASFPKLPDKLDNIGTDALRSKINSFNVLYAAPAADISAEVKGGK